mmetsp:Transcript_73435/g.215368  ORF Transcript_73435/g.215368 Transcript_73435/m.215368 type:complete len:351 (-) Transcript_73435:241-1293(-)
MGNVILPMWAQCPALTRMFCVGCPVLSVVLMILESTPVGWLVQVFFVCSIRTIMRFWLWTLFIGPFYSPVSSGMAFLFKLFEVYMVMMYFPLQEQELGSSMLLCWTLVMNALVNLVYLLINGLIWMVYSVIGKGGGERYLEEYISGLWPLIMVSLTIRGLRDPQGSTSFWGFVQIPNKWYPICLVAFFCLLSGMRILWNLIAALVIGYTYGVVQYERLMPSRVRLRRLEERCCSSRNRGLLGASWVPVTQTAGYEAEAAGRRYSNFGGAELASRGRDAQQSSAGSPSRASFEAFSGSGTRLGDGSDLTQPLAPTQPVPQTPEVDLEGSPQEVHVMPSPAPDQSSQGNTAS